MAQNVFLKTESILPATKQDVSVSNNTSSSTEDIDRKEFSSELNKQIDRHHRHEKRNENSPASTQREGKVAKPSVEKAEKIDNKSGKDLPVEADADGEFVEKNVEKASDISNLIDNNLELTSEKNKPKVESSTTDLKLESKIDVETEVTSEAETIDAPTVIPVSAITESDKPQLKIKTATKATGEQVKNSAQENKLSHSVLKAIDADEIKPETGKAQQKTQPEPLRSDILNALLGKSEQKKIKFTGPIAKSDALSSEQINSKVLSESQQLAALIKQAKSEQTLPTQPRDVASASTNLISASVSSATASSTPVQSAPTLTMQPVVQSEAWNLVLSNRVTWMAREGVQRAVLQLNPANLGPVEVRLNIQNEQATVTFTAQHALTREALEQALPRLKESMQENDLELIKAEVNQQSSEQEDKQEDDVSLAQQAENMAEEDSDGSGAISIESGEAKLGLSLYA